MSHLQETLEALLKQVANGRPNSAVELAEVLAKAIEKPEVKKAAK